MDELSYWFRATPDKLRFPVLSGDADVDAVVIGGGVAGLSTAYFLSKAGIKTALLEANTIGTGDSGYTTAFATRFLDTPEATVAAWDVSETSLNLLRRVITEENIDCDWEQIDSIGFTRDTDKAARKKFLQAVTLLQARDPSIEYFTGKKASQTVGLNASAAYRKKAVEGQFHIRKFLVGLAERAVKNGALLFENSGVIDIKSLENKITVQASTGKITSSWLIVATGSPLQQFFPVVAEQLSAAVSYVIDVKFADKKPFPRALFWDNCNPYHYFRWVGSNELLLGGADWLMRDKKPSDNPHTQLETWLKEVSPNSAFNIINRWQGTLFYTPDLLPFIASHQIYGDKTLFLTGWGSNGTTLGFFSGVLAADIVQYKKNRFQNLFSFTKHS